MRIYVDTIDWLMDFNRKQTGSVVAAWSKGRKVS
jgi:hypothetical protein